jgi:hypothetical protein
LGWDVVGTRKREKKRKIEGGREKLDAEDAEGRGVRGED